MQKVIRLAPAKRLLFEMGCSPANHSISISAAVMFHSDDNSTVAMLLQYQSLLYFAHIKNVGVISQVKGGK